MARALPSVLLFLFTEPALCAQQVQIGVLGLFHPHEITLSATKSEALVVTAGENVFVLGPDAPGENARIEVSQDDLLLEFHGRLVHATEIVAVGRNQHVAGFVLGIPGKITRQYQGALRIRAIHGEVVPIVTMDLETAVASVVAAELTEDAPLEAMKAQAIVTRSYFLAGKGRHHDFDFCDTTHCQFLREPPSAESRAAAATLATRGLVIAFEGKPVAAMFTRSCGGRTRTPAEVGVSFNRYPYYSVVCDFCYQSPVRWTRQISEQDAARLIGKGEAGRLAVDRRLGWNTIPSNDFAVRVENGRVILNGKGQGHGIGLCQRGAGAMAKAGSSFREILSHYFPNTTLALNPDAAGGS
ncbi:MAG TPA: SpoIID/LytB domain-containing protein [Candidatus Angelobacter sp.]|nr:SpoIID/LytB domain-containing protein [Candidatus Angelobacter sp.]